MRPLVLALVCAIATNAYAQAPQPGQTEFEAATALEGKGEYARAADALEKLGHDQPQSSYADDALFEAAVIAEEHLSDPARAARLYEQVATQYPSSRLARRARTRADFLHRSLSTGEAPLRDYEAILREAPRRPPDESMARMEKLLREHPDFALADRALYWLGTTNAELGRDARAIQYFLEVEQRFPSTEWASRAKKSRADLLLREGKRAQARQVYDELSRSSDLIARAAGQEGLAAVRTGKERSLLFWLALAYVVLFLLVHVIALRRLKASFRVPVELWFYLPVALLFVLAAATENGAVAWATSAIAVGGGLVVWASCALTNAGAGGRLWLRVARLVAAALAVVCVMYLAVQTTGLTDLMLETLRSGPER